MISWTVLRLWLLRFTFLGVGLTIVQVSSNSQVGQRSFTPIQFPAALPLPGWELQSSQSISTSVEAKLKYDRLLSAQQYRYQQAQRSLQVELRYVGNTSGDASKLYPAQANAPVYFQPEVGFYSVFTVDDRTHLLSCLNPDGKTTVTAPQFLQNHRQDLHWQRLPAWFLGQTPLQDHRCLWFDLSTPAGTAQTDFLKTAWLNLLPHWRARFPL